jgi:GrpB-like predicted nucleotidyltransferase (UPF0157 family)
MPNPSASLAVQVLDYDPDWPRIFLQLRDHIWPSVQDVAVAIEHVGSTSVPGMAAKPVIDIDVVIPCSSDLPLVTQRLAVLGYQPRGDLGVEDREAFRKPENQPPHHLYVCVQNTLALRNHIAVRDYLRSHPTEATAYSELKKRLAERFQHERERYGQGKTDFILALLEKCGFPAEALDGIKSVQ